MTADSARSATAGRVIPQPTGEDLTRSAVAEAAESGGTGLAPRLRAPKDAVTNLLASLDLNGQLARAQQLALPGQGLTLMSGLSSLIDPSAVLAEVQSYESGTMTALSQEVATAQAVSARDVIDQGLKDISGQVQAENESVDQRVTQNLANGGFVRQGTNYSRQAIVNETVIEGADLATQTIAGYRYFTAPAYQWTVDLSQEALAGMSAGAIDERLTQAQASVASYKNQVFGDAWVTNADGTSPAPANIGYFGTWVGNAPTQSVGGKGELGRIYGLYDQFETALAQGIAAMAKPVWDQPLWNSPNANLKAPSLVNVGEIAAAVVATVATYGMAGTAIGALAAAGIVAGASVTTDAVFTGMDVAAGYQKPDDALVNFGLRTLSTIATSSIGAAASGLSLGVGSGVAGIVEKGAIDLGTAVLDNAATGFIDGFSYDSSKGGWQQYNANAFTDSLFGKSALAGYAGSAASTLVNAGLSAATSGFDGSQLAGLSKQNQADVAALDSFAGGLASSAVQYALSGQTTLNVLNTADFGSKASVGLVELNLGGSDGWSLNVGTGGTDVSLSALASAARGMGVVDTNSEISDFTTANNLTGNEASLRALYGFGDAKGQALLQGFLDGSKTIGSITGQDAKTVGNTIELNATDLGGDLNQQLDLATVLEQEAWRTGTNDGGSAEIVKGLYAVAAHTGFAERVAQEYGSGFETSGISNDIAALTTLQQSGNIANYVGYAAGTYDLTDENWQETKGVNGSVQIVDDGDPNQLTIVDQQTGQTSTLAINQAASLSAQFGAANGLSQSQMNALMAQAGWTYGANGWQANGQPVDISAQTIDQDVIQNVVSKVTSIFGLSPNVAAPAVATPGVPTGGYDLNSWYGNVQSEIYSSMAIVEGETLVGKPYAVPDANGYASGENEGINGIISLASTNLDCVGLVSAIFQTPVYSALNFASNPYFQPVSTNDAQPGDVIIYNGTTSKGEPDGHAVVYIGGTGSNMQVLQSDQNHGVRTSVDTTLQFYTNQNYTNITQQYYRYNGKKP